MFLLSIFSRWVHVASACIIIGGVFFLWFMVPRGVALLEEASGREVFLAIRRSFKRIVHWVILLLLLSGIYNSWLAWDKYNLDKAVLHSLWGTHILLATLAISISLYVLAGRQPPRSHRAWMAVNFVILLLTVAAASSLKWARERAVSENAHKTIATSTLP